jgi:hypothetical protein
MGERSVLVCPSAFCAYRRVPLETSQSYVFPLGETSCIFDGGFHWGFPIMPYARDNGFKPEEKKDG